MTPEAQQIAIAEACPGIAQWEPDIGEWLVPCPGGRCSFDPLHDLNAMHEAEKVLTLEQRVAYIATLLPLTGTVQQDLWYTAHATAAERAEAFLRTLGKWRDDK